MSAGTHSEHSNTRHSMKTREVLWRWILYKEGKTHMPRLVWREDHYGYRDLYSMTPNEILAGRKMHG